MATVYIDPIVGGYGHQDIGWTAVDKADTIWLDIQPGDIVVIRNTFNDVVRPSFRGAAYVDGVLTPHKNYDVPISGLIFVSDLTWDSYRDPTNGLVKILISTAAGTLLISVLRP